MRGLGGLLADEGVDATVFCYPGQQIKYLNQRLHGIFSAEYQPRNIVVQCGGNDAEARPPHLVVSEYDELVKELKRMCPHSNIILNQIPARGLNPKILENIAKINTYLNNRGKRGDGVFFNNPCPIDRQLFKSDLVHFNAKGMCFFARKLSTYLVNFHWCLQK